MGGSFYVFIELLTIAGFSHVYLRNNNSQKSVLICPLYMPMFYNTVLWPRYNKALYSFTYLTLQYKDYCKIRL